MPFYNAFLQCAEYVHMEAIPTPNETCRTVFVRSLQCVGMNVFHGDFSQHLISKRNPVGDNRPYDEESAHYNDKWLLLYLKKIFF